MYRSTRLTPLKTKGQRVTKEKSQLFTMKPLFEDIKAPFPVKFIIFSCNYGLNFKNLQLFAYACSQLQIISVLIITVLKSFNQNNNNWFHKAFATVSDIFSVAGLFDFVQSTRVSIMIGVIITLLLAIIAGTIVYISVCIKMSKTPSYRIQLAWCSLIDIYPSVLAYPIHYIFLQFLYNYQQDLWATKTNHASIQTAKAFLIFGLILNFVYAFGSLVYFKIQIKTKDLFSAKTSLVEIFDFMYYKTLLPIFFVLSTPEDSLYITLLCINLGYALFRDWLFFWFLPFYRVPVLKAVAKVHSLLTALALSGFLSKIISFERAKENFAFTALLWLVFASLLSQFHTKYLWKLLLEIVGEPGKALNQYHLLHYWDVYKYLTARCKAIRPKAQKSDEKYLLYNIAINQIKAIQKPHEKLKTLKSQVSFYVNQTEEENAFETDSFVQLENLKLLKASAQKSPHNWFIKMQLARYYLKYKSYYILADDLVNEVLKYSLFLSQKAPLYIVKLQLLHRVNKREIENENDSHATGLNIQTYLKSQSMFNEFKTTIINQLKPQMKFWSIFDGNSIDSGLLMSLAREVCTKADKVKKHWTYYRQLIDLNFTKPLLIYGFYQSFAQNDFETGDKLISEFYDYELIREKKKAEFNRGEQDTILLTPDTLFFEISGSSNSMGRIIDCSSGVVKCFGYVRDFLIGKSINILMPTFFGERHDNFIRFSQDSIENKVLNKPREITIIDKHGYLKVCQIYITWRFNPQIGLCYYILLRQRENNKETVLLDEKGQMLNCSRGFELDMGFEKNLANFNLCSLCPKLEEIVYAANTVGGEYRPDNLSLNRFQTGNYSQAQLSSSHRIRTMQFDKVDTKANLDMDYHWNIYEKYLKGDSLSFQTFNKRKRDKLAGKKDAFVSYHAKFELCAYEDGGKIIKLSLLKNKDIGTYLDDTHLYTIETQNELNSPGLGTIQKDDQQSVVTLSPAMIWSPDDKKSILKKRSAFGKTSRITEGNDYTTPYSSTSRQLVHKVTDTPKSPPNGKVFRFDTDTLVTGANMLISSPREDLESRVKTLRSQIYKNDGDVHNHSEGMFSEDDEPLKILSPTSSGTTAQANLKAGVNIRVKEENMLAKENLLQNQFGRAESSTGSITLERLKTFRLLRKLSKVRKYGRPTILFNLHFIVTTAFLIAVLIWLNYKSLAASNKSTDYTGVLEALRYRNVWINIANQETRFWTAIQGGWLGWTLQSEILTTNRTWNMTNSYNQKLMRAITNLDTDQQQLFFEKDVRVFVRNRTNGKVFESYQNTFDVVDRLVDKGFKNVYRPPPTGILVNFTNADSRFIFDNSFDDLFIRSEKLVNLMENGFLDSLSNIKDDMKVGLGFAIALVCILGMVAFYYTWSINHEVSKFLAVLLSIQSKETQRISSALAIYYEILTKEQEYDRTDSGDAVQTYFDLKRKQVLETSKLFISTKTRAKEPSQASLFKIYLANYIFFVCLCFVLVAKIIFVSIYYKQGLNNISTIEMHQSQINMALNNMKSHSLISAQLQSLVIDNATTTIKNRPVLEGLTEEINTMDTTYDLYQTFGDENGVSSPRIKELLFNLTCNSSYSPEYINPNTTSISQCNRLSKGMGWLGLVEVLSILATNMKQFFAFYRAADKSTAAALRAIYVKIPSGQIQAIDLSITYSLLLFEATIENFKDLSSKLENQRTQLTWIAFLLSFLLAIAAWQLIIKKLADRQFYKKDILSLLPIKLLYNNRMLKKYATTN